MGLVDILFPKRCVQCRAIGSYLCSICFTYLSFDPERICLMCNHPSLDGLTHPGCQKPWGIDGAFASLSYNGSMKRLLFSFKYRPFVSDLKSILGELFYEGIIQNEVCVRRLTQDSIFMPIPLHNEKLRKRGYNHAAILALEIGHKFQKEVIDGVIRTKKTESQFLLKKEDRAENVKDAFLLSERNMPLVKNKVIFLIDDIVTTGSTLKEVAKVLKKSGVKEVYGLTLAHGH